MKYQKLKKTFRLAALPLAVSLSLGAFVNEASATSQIAAPIKTSRAAVNNKKADLKDKLVKEAVDAFKATETALKALQNNQPKQALSALQVASGNLHLLLSRDPSLSLVPIDIQVEVIEGLHDLPTIKKIEATIDDLIDDNQYQAARPLLDSLVDELRITTVSLPMATYPVAIDEIAPLIDAGKLDEAKKALIAVLNSYVVDEEVIPLPIIDAEEKLSQAFQIEHTEDLSKQETKKKIEQLVNQAEKDIQVAEALGYGVKDEFSGLYEGIHALKKAIGESGFKGEWLKLKKALGNFSHKFIHPAG